jgi:hypothetical protein
VLFSASGTVAGKCHKSPFVIELISGENAVNEMEIL